MEISAEELREDQRIHRHSKLSCRWFPHEERTKYGYWELHSVLPVPLPKPRTLPLPLPEPRRTLPTPIPEPWAEIIEARLKTTFLDPSTSYWPALDHSRPVEIHQKGYTRRYTLSEGITIQATTCYPQGHIVTEGYIDDQLTQTVELELHWFAFMVVRHLQLAREVFEPTEQPLLWLLIGFAELDEAKMVVSRQPLSPFVGAYQGYHEDIALSVRLSEITDRDRWDFVFPSVEKIVDEVGRIFGLSDVPQYCWVRSGELRWGK